MAAGTIPTGLTAGFMTAGVVSTGTMSAVGASAGTLAVTGSATTQAVVTGTAATTVIAAKSAAAGGFLKASALLAGKVILGGVAIVVAHPVIAVVGVSAVGGGGYAAYRYWFHSKTLESNVQTAAKALETAIKPASESQKEVLEVITKQLEDVTKNIDRISQENAELKKQLAEKTKGFLAKTTEIIEKAKDKLPVKLRQKVGRLYNATIDGVQSGLAYVYKITFKNHPYLTTITIIAIPTIYVIKKYYGKQIRKLLLRICNIDRNNLAIESSI